MLNDQRFSLFIFENLIRIFDTVGIVGFGLVGLDLGFELGLELGLGLPVSILPTIWFMLIIDMHTTEPSLHDYTHSYIVHT